MEQFIFFLLPKNRTTPKESFGQGILQCQSEGFSEGVLWAFGRASLWGGVSRIFGETQNS